MIDRPYDNIELWRHAADDLRKERRERGECPTCGGFQTHQAGCPEVTQ